MIYYPSAFSGERCQYSLVLKRLGKRFMTVDSSGKYCFGVDKRVQKQTKVPTTLTLSVDSQMPSAQNNSYATVAYTGSFYCTGKTHKPRPDDNYLLNWLSVSKGTSVWKHEDKVRELVLGLGVGHW